MRRIECIYLKKLYQSVIDDVIANVRDVFLDDGVDEQVLLDLKQTWEKKLSETKATEDNSKDIQQQVVNQASSNGQSAVIQNSSNNQRGNQNRNPYSRDAQHLNPNQAQTHYVQHVATHQSQPQQGRQMQQTQQMHPQVSQAPTVNAVRQLASGSSPLTQQLTLGPGLVQPTLFQYTTTGEGVDGQKITLLPQKVTLAFNPPVMSSSAAAATLALPPELTASLFHQLNPSVLNVSQPQTSVVQHTNQTNALNSGSQVQFQSSSPATIVASQQSTSNNRAPQQTNVVQLDGPNESSDEEEDDEDFRDDNDDHDENDEEQNEDENDDPGEEEEPLNSGDDVSDEDPIELFDTENVVVCQYDKITRSRNKWKFHLKDGIMNLQNKDFVFQRAIGDAEW